MAQPTNRRLVTEERHTWPLLTGKPETFPPAQHQHGIGDVQGLMDRLAALEYDSGWRDISTLLNDGLAKSANNGRANIRWFRGYLHIDMNLTVSADRVVNIFTIPVGWRPDTRDFRDITFFTSASADSSIPRTRSLGYLGANSSVVAATSFLPNPGTVMINAELPITRPLPTSPIGDPA